MENNFTNNLNYNNINKNDNNESAVNEYNSVSNEVATTSNCQKNNYIPDVTKNQLEEGK